MITTAIDPSKGPVVLCIMDGWGHSPDPEHNAVARARTPVFDQLWSRCPHSFLAASGADVGLPDGQVGNSEVGHMNIGAGRVVVQDLPRLNEATENGSLQAHAALKELASTLQHTGGTAHVIGLLSAGGVHAHQDHILAVVNGLAEAGSTVVIHGFTDGRDVLPRDAGISLQNFVADLPDNASIGSLTGRYFGMDRDHRWDRTQKAYDAIARGRAEHHADDAMQALQTGYVRGESDEFLSATIIGDYAGMHDGDGLVMMNFRADRARQLLDCLYRPEVTSCDTRPIALCPGLGMTSYSAALDGFVTPLYPPVEIADTLGDVVAAAGLRQLRLAETEKYPHVTFFFNGGDETMRDGEDRAMVPSPNVATYDQLPEMSAAGVLAKAVASLQAKAHDLLVINFANPDMVGHTGDLDAAIAAVETVDSCIGELVAAVQAADGQMLLTADHGNCEVMWDKNADSPHTAHTTNPVPLILVNGPPGVQLTDGRLADLAPSLLAMLGIDQPASMTGRAVFGGLATAAK
jgi:2,3-bisphosphoglycerate-independent phosphoglycerate mutase